MSNLKQYRQSEKLLVIMPTWVGDCVMAIPALRSFRQLYPNAHIAALVKEGSMSVIEDCPYLDQIIPIRKRPASSDEPKGSGRACPKVQEASASLGTIEAGGEHKQGAQPHHILARQSRYVLTL